MFIGGWAMQIIGHRLFEKNLPSTHKGWITYQLTGVIHVCEQYGEMLARRSQRKAGTAVRPPEPGRNALLDAGQRLLGTSDLARISVNAIVAEAGMAKGSFYQHWPSRHRLRAGTARPISRPARGIDRRRHGRPAAGARPARGGDDGLPRRVLGRTPPLKRCSCSHARRPGSATWLRHETRPGPRCCCPI